MQWRVQKFPNSVKPVREPISFRFRLINFRDPHKNDRLSDPLTEKKMLFTAKKIYASESARFASKIMTCSEKILSERRKVFRQTTKNNVLVWKTVFYCGESPFGMR